MFGAMVPESGELWKPLAFSVFIVKRCISWKESSNPGVKVWSRALNKKCICSCIYPDAGTVRYEVEVVMLVARAADSVEE